MTANRPAETAMQATSHEDLPVRQRALVARVARAWARDQGELDLFEADRPSSPDRTGGEVFESYMTDAWDLLQGSGISELLAMADMLSKQPPARAASATDLDAIETYIAQQNTEIGRIDAQLENWRAGKLPNRDVRWAQNAQRAIEAKTINLRSAHKLRLRFTRDEIMAEIVAGRDAQIANLLEQNRSDKKKRQDLVARADVTVQAMKDFIRAEAPHLFEGMLEKVSTVQAAHDDRISAEAAALLNLAAAEEEVEDRASFTL